MKIKYIKKIKHKAFRYDLQVDDFSCYYANGILIHNTDGQNLMFTWKNGEIRFARNGSHIKNFGEKSMTKDELASKFKGRGGLEMAYNATANDLETAIIKLSEKQRDKIFKNGQKFMSVEVMHINSENVVHYGVNELRFHGTRTYDIDGNVTDDTKEDGRVLAGMITQIRQDKQGTFQIKSLEKVGIPKVPKFREQMGSFYKELGIIQKKFRLKETSTILEYKIAYFTELLKSKGIDYNDKLVSRWAKGDKSYAVKNIKSDYSGKELSTIIDIDKDIKTHQKNVMLPFEHLVLRLGSVVLKNISTFMVLDPKKSTEKLKNDLINAVEKIESTKDPKLLKKLKLELERLNKAGGIDAIFPEEGITFIYDGGFYKLTGTFAPLNQILGMLWNI